jgi:hypothetical protein
MAWYDSGSIGKVFLVVNFTGRPQGLIIEPTSIELRHEVDGPHFRRVLLEGFVIREVDPGSSADHVSPQPQLTQGTPQLPQGGSS